MDMILSYSADLLLITATLGAGIFCFVLSRRLTRLSSIDNGLGGAIAVLSAQVDDMSKALADTKTGSEGSAQRLEAMNAEAKSLLEELELVMAACHDVGNATADKSAPEVEEPPAHEEEDGADLVPMFGSRRDHAKVPVEPPIPLFLKSKSRLAGLG